MHALTTYFRTIHAKYLNLTFSMSLLMSSEQDSTEIWFNESESHITSFHFNFPSSIISFPLELVSMLVIDPYLKSCVFKRGSITDHTSAAIAHMHPFEPKERAPEKMNPFYNKFLHMCIELLDLLGVDYVSSHHQMSKGNFHPYSHINHFVEC